MGKIIIKNLKSLIKCIGIGFFNLGAIIKNKFEFIFSTIMFLVIIIIITTIDFQVQIFILRALISIAILFVAIEFFRSTGYIDNYRLSKKTWIITKWLFIYFVLRVIAEILDSYFIINIGWIVQLAFWVILGMKVRHIRVILGSPKNTTQRIVLRETIDSLISQMEEAKKNTQKMIDISKI